MRCQQTMQPPGHCRAIVAVLCFYLQQQTAKSRPASMDVAGLLSK